MAAIFFRETPEGTPVEVIGHGSVAESEDAIPLSHDDPEAVPTGPSAVVADAGTKPQDEKKKAPKEEVRGALVEIKNPGFFRSRWRRVKPGETIYLD